MLKPIKILLLVCALMLLKSGFAQIYVAPYGNDANAGTREKPLATLTAARDAARKILDGTQRNAPLIIEIADGAYQMTEPLILLPEDGGTTNFPVIYKAAENAGPVFSGGKKIRGFKVNADGIWQVAIPECIRYNWRFDQLYINGKRATLARTPNKEFLHIKDIKQNVWIKGTGRAPEKAQQIIRFDDTDFAHLQHISEKELDLVRFKAFHKWDFTWRHIDKIEKDSFLIHTSGQGMKPWNPLKKGGRIYFENFKAALDAPGEWFLDPDGVLFYYPKDGETPENTEVVASVLGNLITVKGDAASNKRVENIRFEGLTFKDCHYRLPRTGSEPNQAAALINAAIMLEGAQNIAFKKCEITNTGQHALWFGKGCKNNRVEECYLHNLGGGGIYLGDFQALKGEEHTSNTILHNNIIQSGGKEFPSAVGIWVGHSSDNEITNNDIGDFYYTGISIGWVWGYAESLAKRNIVKYNNIHHIGWDLLSDMAAVYTLGKSEGTDISNNIIHHIHAYSYGGWGLYPDEGTSGIVMENNLVYSTKTGGFHQHYGKENVIRNNILAFAKMYQAQCTRVEKHRSFTFENNIIVFDEGVVLQGAWEKIDIKMDKNLYWNISGDTYRFNGKSFKEWQKSGHDANSIIADPKFKNAKALDFQLASQKNTKKIGFEPFDYSKAGVYGSNEWLNKAILSEARRAAFDKAVELNMKKDTKRD